MKNLLLLSLCFINISHAGQYLGQGREIAITDRDTGYSQTVNANGRGDVVQHAHPDSSTVIFTASLSTSGSYILIDLSDTTNWKHVNTDGWAHIENIQIEIDATNTADYVLDIGFVEDVTATNGDFYGICRISGNKILGSSKNLSFDYYPNGPRGKSGGVVTSIQSLNDTTYQSDVNLPTTISTGSATTPPARGDIILDATISAGSISVTIIISYHSDGAEGE